MATQVYRNVDLTTVLLQQLPVQIATIQKDVAKEETAKRGITDNFSVFAFKRYQKAKKYSSIDAIPISALPLRSSIGIISTTGENYAVEIALEFLRMFFQIAPTRTNNYRNSLRFTLNGRIRAPSSLRKIQQSNPLRSSEIIEVWSAVEYASTLEAPNYNVDGIFLKITKALLAKWGSKAAIRFTYRSGAKLMQPFKYTTPVVMIGARGQFASSITTRRGYQMRKRKRALKKQKKDRAAAAKRRVRS